MIFRVEIFIRINSWELDLNPLAKNGKAWDTNSLYYLYSTILICIGYYELLGHTRIAGHVNLSTQGPKARIIEFLAISHIRADIHHISIHNFLDSEGNFKIVFLEEKTLFVNILTDNLL